MLTKQEVKACLAGQCSSYMPAWLLWMDGKFRQKNQADVKRMQEQYDNDFIFAGGRLVKRSRDARGKCLDTVGCDPDIRSMLIEQIAREKLPPSFVGAFIAADRHLPAPLLASLRSATSRFALGRRAL